MLRSRKLKTEGAETVYTYRQIGVVVVYLKSIGAGVAAVVLTLVVLPLLVAVIRLSLLMSRLLVKGGFAGIGIDRPVLHFTRPPLVLWLAALFIFCVGFFWEFRRLSK